VPQELAALLGTKDATKRELAWSRFVETHSRLILHSARSPDYDYDSVMDRYTYALEKLKKDDFRRLRTYVADGRGKFTTWLAVVVRRLALDLHRERVGRVRDSNGQNLHGDELRAARKRLAGYVADHLDVNRVSTPARENPEHALQTAEVTQALGAALGEIQPRDRLLLAMRFEEDLSAREIAGIMDFPTPFHVYRRLNRVLAMLRGKLESRGIDNSIP
jgi:RNA polymerase sigma factor (sigma-70 family)